MQNVDESYLIRLAHVKALFRMGLDSSERATAYSSAQAVLTFDNALEMMFKLSADKLQIVLKERDRQYLPSLVREVDAKLADSQLKIASLDELHEIRNKIQHNGLLPDRTVVDRYKRLTLETLSYLSSEVFGLKWGQISLSEMIVDDKIREIYRAAEQAYHDKDYKKSVFYLLKAFETSKRNEQGQLHGSGLILGAVFTGMATSDSNTDTKALATFTGLLASELEILKLRLDYKAYMKFRQMFNQTNAFVSPYIDAAGVVWDSMHPLVSIQTSETQKRDEYLTYQERQEAKEKYVDEEARRLLLIDISPKNDSELQLWIEFALEFVLDAILRWERIKR